MSGSGYARLNSHDIILLGNPGTSGHLCNQDIFGGLQGVRIIRLHCNIVQLPESVSVRQLNNQLSACARAHKGHELRYNCIYCIPIIEFQEI